jgi:hypothetical protein
MYAASPTNSRFDALRPTSKIAAPATVSCPSVSERRHSPPGLTRVKACNCLAVRRAARHITQFYDQLLAPSGLRTTQRSLLAKLRRLGPMTINALAAEIVMDRTKLGRNILPSERDGLIALNG